MNIVDSFKKCCSVMLVNGIMFEGNAITYIPFIEIIRFDVIGIFIDFDGQMCFIPWGNIIAIYPEVGEGKEIEPNLGERKGSSL
jgi:hypothetical protein